MGTRSARLNYIPRREPLRRYDKVHSAASRSRPARNHHSIIRFKEADEESAGENGGASRAPDSALLAEEGEIDRIGHGLIAGIVRVEMVAAIVRGQVAGWVRRVVRGGVEINNAVIRAAADKFC